MLKINDIFSETICQIDLFNAAVDPLDLEDFWKDSTSICTKNVQNETYWLLLLYVTWNIKR